MSADTTEASASEPRGGRDPAEGPTASAEPERVPAGRRSGQGPDRRGSDPENAEIGRRLRSVAGHVRGVEKMVEEGAYCVDIVRQIFAVQRALSKVSGRVLDRHLRHCVTEAVRGEDPEERERVLSEIMGLFEAVGRS